MRSRLAFVALVLVALMIGLASRAPDAQAQAARATQKVYGGTVNLTASNAPICSTVGSNDVLVIHALSVATNTAGTLVITDGSGGVELARLYLAANVVGKLNAADLGPAGIRCSRGNTPYANAISSATAVSYTLWTDRE